MPVRAQPNSPSPPPLTLDRCPLLAKADPTRCAALTVKYNELVAFYQWLLNKCPTDVLPTKLDPIQVAFDKLRARLTRVRYQVGFLGTFQSGKSTTFNRILGAEIAKSGTGNATTAVVTRLVSSSDSNHRLTLRYLLESEYQERRREMCESIGIPATQSDNEIKRQIPELKREAALKPGGNDRADALNHLLRLLDSYELFRDKLRSSEPQRVEQNAQWNELANVLNHPKPEDAANPSATALLESARIEFCTSAIPPELELIDLPGLGSVNVFDDWLTNRYILNLDGAFIFNRADTVQDRHTSDFLKKLRDQWPLEGRAWLCFTKTDITNKFEQYFHNVLKFAQQRSLPLNQLCWLCNDAGRLNANFQHQPDLQLTETAAFGPAWNDLYHDGGLTRLKSLILKDVPRLVGEGILKEAMIELRRLSNELETLAKVEFCGPAASGMELGQIHKWSNDLSNMAHQVDSAGRGSEQAAELSQCLMKSYAELHVDPKVLDRERNYSNRFRRVSETLEVGLQRELRHNLIDKGYKHVLSRIEDMERPQRMRVPTVAEDGLATAWERFQNEDKTSTAWQQKTFPSFVENNPYEGVDNNHHLMTGAEYEALFQEKIRVVSRQVVHRLQRRLKDRLHSLLQALEDYSTQLHSQQAKTRNAELEKYVLDFFDRFNAV